MFAVAGLLVLAAASASAYPHIPENFVSQALISAQNETHVWDLSETWWRDLTGQRQRIDTIFNGNGTLFSVEFLEFWGKNPTKYSIATQAETHKQTCDREVPDDKMEPMWSWLEYAKEGKACQVNLNKGVHWTAEWDDKHTKSKGKLDMCLGYDSTPLSFEMQGSSPEGKEHIMFVFTVFIPTRPANKDFEIPKVCDKHQMRSVGVKSSFALPSFIHNKATPVVAVA
jgi:hypothetical protein